MHDSVGSRFLQHHAWLVVCVLAGLLFWQCSDHSTNPYDPPARELTKTETELVSSSNAFGLKLFKAIADSEPDSNIFISPLSVALALGMTYNGAAGDTKEAIAATLELAGLTDEDINESYQSLMALLMSLDPQVRFQIANSIWYRQELQVEQDFVDVNQTYFDAVVSALDFASADATRTINTWVNDKTNGRIESIIDYIPADVVMYLINAIYFKGTWTCQFDPSETVVRKFRREDGSEVPCKLMYVYSNFSVVSNEFVTAVDLPYGRGDFSMMILLPRYGSNAADVIAALTDETWNEWISGLSETETGIRLPRFKFEYEKTLNDVLKALGMEIAFTPAADFTRIRRSGGLAIDEVKHKSFVEVNEEGTEAAAVTVVSGPASGPPTINMTRPFVYAIRDSHSGTILFIGTMMDPPQGD